MKILFCGGGTGGHVSPAIAIAEYSLKNFKDIKVAFVGRLNGEENKPIKKRGYKLYEIEIHGFDRKISLKNLKNVFVLSGALRKSKTIINEFKPDAVIGTGGYVSWPIIKCAQRHKIPTFIHESNAYPGLVTRLLAPKCNKVLLNLPEAKNHLKRQDNIKNVGNPVRAEFYTTERKKARELLGIKNNEFLIVSFGGSGGSKKLNEVILDFIREYSLKDHKIKHIHGCGTKYFENITEAYPELKNDNHGVSIKPYIENIHILLNASDLVISRSGAMTVSELAASKSASILIPSPNVTNNHQYKNAKSLADKNAAVLIEEENLTAQALINTVKEIRKNLKLRNELKANIGVLFQALAEKKILEEVIASFDNLPDN